MTRIAFAPEVRGDFDRIFDHIAKYDLARAPERILAITSALEVLRLNPQIGRPVARGLRELVIGRGTRGYVALYQFMESTDTVLVVAVRAQREAGYGRP